MLADLTGFLCTHHSVADPVDPGSLLTQHLLRRAPEEQLLPLLGPEAASGAPWVHPALGHLSTRGELTIPFSSTWSLIESVSSHECLCFTLSLHTDELDKEAQRDWSGVKVSPLYPFEHPLLPPFHGNQAFTQLASCLLVY